MPLIINKHLVVLTGEQRGVLVMHLLIKGTDLWEVPLLVEHLRHRNVMPDYLKAIVRVLIVSILDRQCVLMLFISTPPALMHRWLWLHKLSLVIGTIGAAIADNNVV